MSDERPAGLDCVEVARQAVAALLEDIATHVRSGDHTLHDQLQEITEFDDEGRRIATDRPTWGAAVEAIARLPFFQERFGQQEVRITIQLVYQAFHDVADLNNWHPRFEASWRAIVEDVNDPNWRWISVATLENATEGIGALEFGLAAGVTVLRRSPEVDRRCIPIGLAAALDGNSRSRQVASSFVLLAETLVAKTPQSYLSLPPPEVTLCLIRALGALRLTDSGDIGIWEIVCASVPRFDVGDHGPMSFMTAPRPRDHESVAFELDKNRLSQTAEIFLCLKQLENHGYKSAPGNLDVALKSFMLFYDASPSSNELRIIHLVTAAEALVGSENGELTFRLSSRVSGLLAADDETRVDIFQRFKSFYDTRSKLVHGSTLATKHRRDLCDLSRLAGYVRTLLRGWVRLAAGSGSDREEARMMLKDKRIDATLMSAVDRASVRTALGFEPSR